MATLIMVAGNFREWNLFEHLKSAEDIRLYIEVCIEDFGDNLAFMTQIHADVECARKLLEQSAKDAGSKLSLG